MSLVRPSASISLPNQPVRVDLSELVDAGTARPPEAIAARMIQLSEAVDMPAGASRIDVIKGRERALVASVPSEWTSGFGRNNYEGLLALELARSTLRASAKIVAKHTQILETACARLDVTTKAEAPDPSVARAFIEQFRPHGEKAALRRTHDHWYVTEGPGTGKTFEFRPATSDLFSRAERIAKKQDGAKAGWTEEHLAQAADELAKELRVEFGSGPGAPSALGRVFGAPYEVLEVAGGYGLARADANNIESVRASMDGLRSQVAGDPVGRRQEARPARDGSTHAKKIQNSDRSPRHQADTRAWSELSDEKQSQAIAYFSRVCRELAQLSLGLRDYDSLSPDALGALSTTYAAKVRGTKRAVPFGELTKDQKDTLLPPLTFGLDGMVREAERSAETQSGHPWNQIVALLKEGRNP